MLVPSISMLNAYANLPIVPEMEWVPDDLLRKLMANREGLGPFANQFLDDMQEFLKGIDAFNEGKAESQKIQFLISRETADKMDGPSFEDIASTRDESEFGLRQGNKIYKGSYYYLDGAMVYGIYFNPDRFTHNKGAFYFGYNPPRSVESYLNWLTERNVFKLEPLPAP